MDEERLLHHDLTRTIIGGAYAIQTQLGAGFLESVYSNGLALILRRAGHAQLCNYLRVSGLHVGLLFYFGSTVRFRRVVMTAQRLGPAARASRSV